MAIPLPQTPKCWNNNIFFQYYIPVEILFKDFEIFYLIILNAIKPVNEFKFDPAGKGIK